MSLRFKLRSLANRRLQEELDDELASHLDMKAEELEAAGWPPEKARLEARRRFGNVGRAAEQAREQHVFTFLETLVHDLRFAVRRLRREPAFTIAAVLTLGLVIG